LTLNGEYYGFFTLVEAIDKKYLKRQGLNNDGTLFKAMNHTSDVSLLWAFGKEVRIIHFVPVVESESQSP
jgi:hypothetical protein